MALGSTQPLTGKFSGGKCGRCVRLTTLPLPCAVVMKSGNLNFLEPSGPLQACNGTALPVYSLRLGFRDGLFPSVFSTETLSVFHFCPNRAGFPVHLFLLEFFTRLLRELYTLCAAFYLIPLLLLPS